MRALFVLAVATAAALNTPAAAAEPALSPAQAAVVAKAVAALKSPEERQMASGWTNAKKAAEMICRPAALPALKRQLPAADRVFLGTDDPKTLQLTSDSLLVGSGTVRAGAGWRDFTFTCRLDPTTGKAVGFEAKVAPAS